MKKVIKFSTLIVTFVLAVLFTLSSLSFAPKSASAINYRGEYICISYEPLSDGRIVWAFDVGLNTETRNLKDENEKGDYRVKIQVMLQKIFDEKRAEYQAIFNANPNAEYKFENIQHANTIYDQQTDSAGFKFYFDSIDAYNFYNTKQTDYSKTTENIFIKRKVKKSVFPFAEVVQTEFGEMKLAQYYRKLFIVSCAGLSIENQIQSYDPQFVFDYCNYSNRIKSNADLSYTDGTGKYHLAWAERANNINNNIIMTRSLTTANRGWWYLFAIAIPLTAMIIAILVIIIKDKKVKNSNNKSEFIDNEKTA